MENINNNENQVPINVYQPSKDEITMAGLIPLLNIFGFGVVSIIIWVIKKDQMPFVNDTGKEFLNYFISMIIYSTVAGLLTFVAIGLILLPVVAIFAIVLSIIAAVKTFKGEFYSYPLIIRFIK